MKQIIEYYIVYVTFLLYICAVSKTNNKKNGQEMDKNEEKYSIIELLTRVNIVRDECIRICGMNEYLDDLTQEVLLILLDYDADKFIEMNRRGKLLNFIRATIRRQYKSCTSPFFTKYRRYRTSISDMELENDLEGEDCYE